MEVVEISSRMDYILQKQEGRVMLDEYKKSIYLTKAQERFVTKILAEYEYTDAMRQILGPLLVLKEETSFPAGVETNMYDLDPALNVKSVVYEYLNEGMMLIPLDWNDIHKTKPNPFRKPYQKLSYRITGRDKFTIFTSETPTKYVYVYCKEPDPIVLENFAPADLKVNGIDAVTTSELPYDSVLTVIDIAVELVMQDISRLTPRVQQEQKN